MTDNGIILTDGTTKYYYNVVEEKHGPLPCLKSEKSGHWNGNVLHLNGPFSLGGKRRRKSKKR